MSSSDNNGLNRREFIKGTAAMIGGLIYFWPTSHQLQRGLDQEYPTKAVQYLKEHPLDANGAAHVQMIRLEVEALNAG